MKSITCVLFGRECSNHAFLVVLHSSKSPPRAIPPTAGLAFQGYLLSLYMLDENFLLAQVTFYMTGISFLGENPKLIHTIYEDDFRTKKLKKDIFCLVTKAWGQGKCMRSYEESNFRPSRSDALPLNHKDLTLQK